MPSIEQPNIPFPIKHMGRSILLGIAIIIGSFYFESPTRWLVLLTGIALIIYVIGYRMKLVSQGFVIMNTSPRDPTKPKVVMKARNPYPGTDSIQFTLNKDIFHHDYDLLVETIDNEEMADYLYDNYESVVFQLPDDFEVEVAKEDDTEDLYIGIHHLGKIPAIQSYQVFQTMLQLSFTYINSFYSREILEEDEDLDVDQSLLPGIPGGSAISPTSQQDLDDLDSTNLGKTEFTSDMTVKEHTTKRELSEDYTDEMPIKRGWFMQGIVDNKIVKIKRVRKYEKTMEVSYETSDGSKGDVILDRDHPVVRKDGFADTN